MNYFNIFSMHQLLNLIYILICFSLIVKNQIFCINQLEGRIPARFSDDLLPGRMPIDGTKEYQSLGRIYKLSNIFQPKLVATKFSIYTRRGQVEDITFGTNHYCYPDTCHGPFQYDLNKLADSGFDPNLRTIILTPGFLTDDRPDWILLAKDLWLQLEDVNIIMTTWKDGNRFIYSAAVTNTPVVARQISILIYYLASINNVDLNDQNFLNRIQLVGHSLGAHISGFVGKDFAGRLSRITGLDPAGPDFDQFPRTRRLDKSDAQLVTIIHSNRGKLNYVKAVAGGVMDVQEKLVFKIKNNNNNNNNDDKIDEKEIENNLNKDDEDNSVQSVVDGNIVVFNNPWFGIDQQLGDIDYYANDGAEQPGCKDFMHICDHGRSTELYGDILRYELVRRSQSINNGNLDHQLDLYNKNRLLAFNSDNFDKFLIGQNFNDKCPALLEDKQAFTGSLEETLNDCAIPIDLTSPVEKFIEELKEDYHLYLDKEHYNPYTKYWFKTQATAPFMGNHYLLKVFINPENSAWDETCSIKAEINMSNGDNIKIETNKGSELILNNINDLDNENNNKFYGLAMPFINPIGQDATKALNNILAKTKMVGKKEMPDISKQIVKIIPSEVRLSITTSNLNYVVQENSTEKCSLNINKIEIQPIVGSKYNIAGIYGNNNYSKSGKKSWFGNKKDKLKRVITNSDPNTLSVNGNACLNEKFRKLIIKHK